MSYSKRCIVTGGAGFIGSALTRLLLKETEATVLVVDKLTYAGVPENLNDNGSPLLGHSRKLRKSIKGWKAKG